MEAGKLSGDRFRELGKVVAQFHMLRKTIDSRKSISASSRLRGSLLPLKPIVILDAKYDRLALRQAVIAQAQKQNIPLQILHCTAPMTVLRDRLNQRQINQKQKGYF